MKMAPLKICYQRLGIFYRVLYYNLFDRIKRNILDEMIFSCQFNYNFISFTILALNSFKTVYEYLLSP